MSAIEFGPAVTVNAPETEPTSPPAIAINAAGDVVVAWSDGFPGGVHAAYRRRGGSFSAPQRLAGRRTEGTGVQAAITASGEALVAWAEHETLAALGRARARVVVASRAAAAGSFARPVELSLGQQGARAPWLGVTPGGEAVAVWEELRTFPRGVRTGPLRVSSATRAAAGAWSVPVGLSDTQRRFTSGVSTPRLERMVPRVAVLASGAALAVWERASGVSTGCCQRVEAAGRPAGGAFGPAQTLTEAPERGFAVLRDVKGAGARWGVLAWNDATLQLSERAETGAFSAPLAIPGALGQFTEAALALAPDGAASVLKGVPLAPAAPCASVDGVYALASTSRTAGGTFGPDRLLTPATQPGTHAGAAVAGARAIFGWEQPRRTAIEEREPGGCAFFGAKPFAAEGPADSGPGPAGQVSRLRADGRWPALASEPSGAAVLAWIGGNGRVRVALVGGGSLGRNRYPDIVAPELRRLRLRPRGVRPRGRMELAFRLPERARVTVRISGRGRLVRRIRTGPRRGPVRIVFRAPAVRGWYTAELVARDRAGNPSSPRTIEGFRVRPGR